MGSAKISRLLVMLPDRSLLSCIDFPPAVSKISLIIIESDAACVNCLAGADDRGIKELTPQGKPDMIEKITAARAASGRVLWDLIWM
jgi:hypothetical protein